MSKNVFSLGLIGYPLEHSLSPRLHHSALAAMAAEGEYRLNPIPPFPEGKLAMISLLESMRLGKLHGLNVTIPHKQNIIELLDVISPTARVIGAVNTVYLDGDRLCGENTDAPGFLADLAQLTGMKESGNGKKAALILGAGGSARAVAFALLQAGWRVMVAARRIIQALELVNGLQTTEYSDRITAHDSDESTIDRIKSQAVLIVNATPVGMWPKIDDSPWPEDISMPQRAKVYDLVYNPAETVLLHTACAAGLPARNGLGMLIEQAALALERWTSAPVPRRPMWESVPEFVFTDRSTDQGVL